MRVISGYRITEQLYESNNSIVYRGQRQADGVPIVLKLLKESYPSPERIAWFKREYEVTRNVNIPGVTRIYGLETDKHHWVMVLEDFGGESLKRLDLSGALGIEDFLYLAINVTEILGQIHQQRIMHKDINPANIVFNPKTRQVKLIDFGIATILSHENPTFRNPKALEGTLAYMSPEQAGRMNRAIDYRTDFYSLGVTFYELLTGEVPFVSDDALEIVHHHIARQPLPPHERRPDIPETLSAIVMRLMAKNAEDRYQSAYGIKVDLETCLRQWLEIGKILPFTLGKYDISDRFQIPQKLYGRERERETILAAFERVSKGTSEMMLVSGSAGIGKSALVQEIYKPLTSRRGYFIAGKFDQFQRNIPYSAFIQAFRVLVRHLLTETEEDIAIWRNNMLQAVGKNGQVLIEVIPEVELIIGPQPPIVALGPTEAQSRINMVFQNFIRLFTKKEHPLVLFLDDLQWADGASLKLIESLMTIPHSTDIHEQVLLLIGAYRDNEVEAGHPLWSTLDTILKAHMPVQQLALDPIAASAITQMVAETMHCNDERSHLLAELVVSKTGGNPFFINEFLKSLHIENLIYFDQAIGQWQWDIEHIQKHDMTTNVVELLATRVQRMPQQTQEIVKLAACIGNTFNLETLSVVSETSPRQTALDLREAIFEGLIFPITDTYKLAELEVDGLDGAAQTEYKFAHDRIQQAAYWLIPEEDRQAVHWRVGQLLFAQALKRVHTLGSSSRHIAHAAEVYDEARDSNASATAPYHFSAAVEERIFDIVNHLNRGLPHKKDMQEERDNADHTTSIDNGYSQEGTSYEDNKGKWIEHSLTMLHTLTTPTRTCTNKLAELNLLACKRAIESAAYSSALSYARTGVELLPHNAWHKCYTLTLALYKEYAKCKYLNGQFERAEELFDTIAEKATVNLDKAEVYNIKMTLYASMGKLQKVIAAGLEGLRLLDLEIGANPTQEEIDSEIEVVEFHLRQRTVADLVHLPNATDANHIMKMSLLKDILIAAWWRSNTRLLYLATLKMVHLSLRFGNAQTSAVGYVWYGAILGSGLGDYQTGYEFGKLALSLNEKYNNIQLVPTVNLVFGVFVQNWRLHLRESVDFLRRGYHLGLEVGDLLWAGINCYPIIYTILIKGEELDDVYQEIQRYLDFATRTQQIIPINMLTLSQQFILSLKGFTRAPGSFSDNNYNEERHIKEIKASSAFRPIFWYYKTKLQALYLFEQYIDAFQIARELDKLTDEGAAFGNVTLPEHYFYYSLTLTALYPSVTTEEQETYWQVLARNQARFKTWARNCPDNYRHKYLLLSAEMARLAGRDRTAKVFYDKAITCANANGYIQNEALAHELAARYYLSKNLDMNASTHFLLARNGYLKWGATAKVKALDKQYPHLRAENRMLSSPSTTEMQTFPNITPSITTTSSGIDITTVTKASQAISGEMVLETLLSKLMRIVIENAGAERGVLILEREGHWVVEAEGNIGQGDVTILQSIPIEDRARMQLPATIINFVARTQESIVLSDASHATQFTQDSYVISHKPRSVLCTPLLNQGQLMGIVYLENNLTTDAFTPDRLEVLNLLAAQAAISIKNAMLYKTLQQSEAKYRNLFQNSKDTIFITAMDGHIIDMNSAGLTLFGYTEEEIKTANVVKMYANPQDRAQYQHVMQQQGSVRDYPVKLCRKDGTNIDCLMTAHLRYSENGTIEGYEGIIRDITEQKRAEAERAALLDQHAQRAGELHAILQSMADGLLGVDKDERIVIVNSVAAQLLGQEVSALLDAPLSKLANVEDPLMSITLQHIVDLVRREMQDSEHTLPEERLVLGERIVRLQTAPTLGTGGTLTGGVVVLQDITEAVESDRAKNAFIATASHEMRTPLASMKGFVDVFYMSGIDNLTESQRMFLDTIRRQTNNLVHMVNELLEVARLEQGALRAQPRWVSVEQTLEECMSNMTAQFEQRLLYVDVNFADNLPMIWIDAMHIRRILTNLISNSVKYVPQGGEIYVRVYELNDPAKLPSVPDGQPWKLTEERSIVVEVEDNGVGIRECDQPKIFSRFFRSENPLSVEAGGSGLGLAITKSLVELHNGQIGFWSVENEGTCFWVRFPAPSTETLFHDTAPSFLQHSV